MVECGGSSETALQGHFAHSGIRISEQGASVFQSARAEEVSQRGIVAASSKSRTDLCGCDTIPLDEHLSVAVWVTEEPAFAYVAADILA